MPLDKSILEQTIKKILTDEKKEEKSSSTSIDKIAAQLATAIDTFVRSGLVTTTVTTTGSATAQSGTGTGSIS